MHKQHTRWAQHTQSRHVIYALLKSNPTNLWLNLDYTAADFWHNLGLRVPDHRTTIHAAMCLHVSAYVYISTWVYHSPIIHCALMQCARGMVQLELGRLKAASWISSRRTSQGSQVCKSGMGSSLYSPDCAWPLFDPLQTLTTNTKPSCGIDHHFDTAWSTMGLFSGIKCTALIPVIQQCLHTHVLTCTGFVLCCL